MNWKNRLTNYNFWISIFSAVLLILQALKIEFDIAYVNEIFTAVLGLLVVIGIISDPTRTTVKTNNEVVKSESTEKVETDKKTEEINQNTLPFDEKDETISVNNENDFQVVLDKMYADIEQKTVMINEKINKLENFNADALNKINSQLQEINKKSSIEEINTPAAAEMGNPYIDVIN